MISNNSTYIQKLHSHQVHQGTAWCLKYLDSDSLLTCGSDKKIILTKLSLNPSKSELLQAFEYSHEKTVRSLSVSNSKRFFASCSFDSTTSVFEVLPDEEKDLSNNLLYEKVATLEGHENEVKCVSWSHDDKFLATCSRDKSVWIWEITEEDEFECVSVLIEHTQDVKFVKWHPNKQLLASASYDNTIKLYRENDDEYEWECIDTLLFHESTVWAVDFNRTGSIIASVGDDKKIVIWRYNDSIDKYYRHQVIENVHSRCIYTISINKSEKEYGEILTGGSDNQICMFENSNKEENLYSLSCVVKNAHGVYDVNCLEFDNHIDPKTSGIKFASCGDDGRINVWSVKKLGK